jgi:hypothetical protein
MMRFLKAILALLLIGLGVAIGWYFADATNPYKLGNQTPTAAPVVVAAAASTPIPTFTAAGATTVTNTTPGAGAGGAGAIGQRAAAPISGTVESYDTATKVMTVKTSAGQSVKIGTSRATVLKPQKLTADEFTQGLSANSFVLIGGDKGADGAYNAKSLTTLDLATLMGGAGGFGGVRPGGQGQAGAGAATTPGAGQAARPGGQAQGQTTPGAIAGAGGQRQIGGAGVGAGNLLGSFGFGAGVAVRGGTLAGTKFTGSTLQGEAVTANISGDTLFQKQIAGAAEDLKPGLSITVIAPATQGDTPAEATIINIG